MSDSQGYCKKIFVNNRLLRVNDKRGREPLAFLLFEYTNTVNFMTCERTLPKLFVINLLILINVKRGRVTLAFFIIFSFNLTRVRVF